MQLRTSAVKRFNPGAPCPLFSRNIPCNAFYQGMSFTKPCPADGRGDRMVNAVKCPELRGLSRQVVYLINPLMPYILLHEHLSLLLHSAFR